MFSLLKLPYSYRTRKILLVVLLLASVVSIGAVGLISQLASRAATLYVSAEPESGTVGNAVKIVTDTTASNGKSLAFGSTSSSGGVSDATLNALIAATPSTITGPAPSGPVAGQSGQFDTSTLATNEVWDNFNGSTLDSRLWQRDTINQGGTQVYQDANMTLDSSGHAVMTATKSGSTIYSGRFTSRQKFAMKYGYSAARIKMPYSGNGVGGAWFPAFWMLLVGYNTNPYAEYDLMEQFGDSKTYSTHLYTNNGNANDDKQSYKPVPAAQGGDASQGYHTYWMLWEANRMRVGVDTLQMGDWSPKDFSAGEWAKHMQQPMYYIFNFAVAPSFLPVPKSTDFPAQMNVDWAWYKPLTDL